MTQTIMLANPTVPQLSAALRSVQGAERTCILTVAELCAVIRDALLVGHATVCGGGNGARCTIATAVATRGTVALALTRADAPLTVHGLLQLADLLRAEPAA